MVVLATAGYTNAFGFHMIDGIKTATIFLVSAPRYRDIVVRWT